MPRQEALPWGATGREAPVFHDPSGRRARVMRVAGTAVWALAAVAVVLVVTAATGFSSLPRLSVAATVAHAPRAHATDRDRRADFRPVALPGDRDDAHTRLQ